MKYTLPEFSYSYNALEPYIDAQTMEIHHTKHHQAYIDKLNAVLETNPAIAEKTVEDLLCGLSGLAIDEKDKSIIRNHGGGYLNHKLFFEIMGPKKEVNEKLTAEIETEFGSLQEFKNKFSEIAKAHFGSGWGWLVRNSEGKLEMYSLPNQDSPYLHGHTPIIGIDVWEHAYYLKYQNRREEYVLNWWNVLKII
ncbi:MAG: superoxide dismutase [Candidatus Jacksonbacteria bacterium RIFCSPLOWO2_02_FULL_44_20]|uniref:Superoxide dismutase n=1 Tax=Candidatus Jacksonbacteria bacterium RIFCSPLOWO2_02_FULL_44_20 TaxID=1798460 RepID=A0A1G2A8Y8_9BACT|nr:MAG: superoxide dismutase [Candidatus Jacksonbacteria bacterium RIFCSPHIGHO2_02_FULL_44_25]OGY73324.1 MAG: superoxide dismutase [Candidatus Jacksonbacteria bacterium RIFCSPLOWO2_02_FULL_44_20]HCE86473.1 superoxide dismutase [Candidatus Jacksonbacteria bacterium]